MDHKHDSYTSKRSPRLEQAYRRIARTQVCTAAESQRRNLAHQEGGYRGTHPPTQPPSTPPGTQRESHGQYLGRAGFGGGPFFGLGGRLGLLNGFAEGGDLFLQVLGRPLQGEVGLGAAWPPRHQHAPRLAQQPAPYVLARVRTDGCEQQRRHLGSPVPPPPLTPCFLTVPICA